MAWEALTTDEPGTAVPTRLGSGDHAALFLGHSELACLMREFDWAQTSIGSPEQWPESLKTAIRIILTSRQPFWIGWGRELIYFYNDPYKSIIGGKHPKALGQPTQAVWREIWPEIGPMLDTALGGKEGTYVEEQLLIMERNGYPEETYYTFSYSPILAEDGTAGGIICANTDDTQRVIGERQLALLRELATTVAEARNWEQACRRAAVALATNPYDLPFAMIYMSERDGDVLSLAGVAGIEPGHPAAPVTLPRNHASLWPAAAALARHLPQTVSDLARIFGGPIPSGAWNQPPARAVVLPIPAITETGQAGALIVGLNPFRVFDATYSGFLDLVVAQIAAAITHAEAYEAERRRAEALAEIDRAKTTFFSNVSHEFRTPLTLMLGPLEELLSRAQPRAGNEQVLIETAHRNGMRLLKLVNSLLDFSRIEAGRIRAQHEPTDISTLTAELASLFRSAIDQAGLRLAIECSPLNEAIYVDRDMWEKIVLNLLSNAFKFTFDGEIGIRVARSADGKAVEVTVRDTGTGIPEHELPHLFERFHRIEGAIGRSFEGSGIGLALVQELVRLNGGSIQVESQLGHGSAFKITLPLGTGHLPKQTICPARTAPVGARAQAYVEEALSWLSNRERSATEEMGVSSSAFDNVHTAAGKEIGRVLLADDSADMRDYLVRLLTDRGHEVEAVADGAAALAAIRRNPPDLVLSDVMMPVLDGFAVLRELRSDAALRDLPVILLSARAGEEARVEGIDTGADDYLTKPFSARELLARVGTNLKMARTRRETLQALRSLNDHLEERVAAEVERRSQTEAQLRQAQKMEAIGQLTGGVAHDMNNLLMVIQGNLERLSRRGIPSGDEAASRAIEAALRSVSRAAALTSQLLAFARRQPLDPKPVEPNRLVASMSDLLRRTLGEAIAIETVLAGGLWRTYADPNQIENAILNLAVNARDAMPNGGSLTIETANAHLDDAYAAAHHEVRPGQYVMIAVSDTGTGMSKEAIEKAFEPFYTTKGPGRGTGLGLSQVYGFVRQSGGHVKIYSEPGQGTTVKIYLPRHLGEDMSADAETAASAPTGRPGETILVVEDDDDVRGNTVESLRELGYRIIEARDGTEAQHALERHPSIRLLFTDVGLPGGQNGRQLANGVRRIRPELKVLFTSGYARNAIVHHGRLDPGVELIVKPYTYAALAEKIRNVLDHESH